MNARARLIAAALAVLGLGSWTGAACAAAADQSRAPTGYSAPALYNLGNSYARGGRPALAVLNYERARLLAPLDPDIRANLRHVRDAAGLPAQTGGWLSRHGRFANPDTMYWLGVLGLSLGGTSLLLRRLAKDRPRSRHRGVLTAGAALGLLLTVLALWDSLATASILAQSVVMQPSPASASPIQGADPLFTVPQADVVGVRDEHAGFALIRDSQGREGWVASSNLTAIIPADPR
jgi:hypothetical protein